VKPTIAVFCLYAVFVRFISSYWSTTFLFFYLNYGSKIHWLRYFLAI